MQPFEVRPLSDALGAEILGLDVKAPIEAATAEALREAWRDHIVLLFRAPDLAQDDQLRLARVFGRLGERPRPAQERPEDMTVNHPAMMLVSNIRVDGRPIGSLPDGEMWFHHDTIYKPKPHRGTMLYAIEVPSHGGNTRFNNLYRAYDALDEAIKRRIAGRKAFHVFDYSVDNARPDAATVGTRDACAHPVVITHPASGRKALYVDRLMTVQIEGLPEDESREILEHMFDLTERPELVYEHVWTPGDLVMWDNLCSAHARTDFPTEERRLLRRCQMEADAPPAA